MKKEVPKRDSNMNYNHDQALTLQPPSDLSAETNLIGALMTNPDARVYLDGQLKAIDFYRETHGWIFDAIMSLYRAKSEIDILTIQHELESQGHEIQGGWILLLGDIQDSAITFLHYKSHAEIIQKTAILRRLLYASGQIAKISYDSTNADEALSESYKLLGEVDSGRKADIEPTKSVLERVINDIDARVRGEVQNLLSTGFKAIDNLVGGMQRGQYWVIAGRPSMGKSALALSIALNVARPDNDGKSAGKVALFSLEMTKDQLLERALSMESRTDNQRLLHGNLVDKDMNILITVAGDIARAPIWVADNTDDIGTVAKIKAKAAKLKAEHGLDVIVIDYMQLLKGVGEFGGNRTQEVGAISREIALMAIDLDCTVIALSQLNREVEKLAEKRPQMSHLRETGDIEQDADVILFVYREEYYHDDSEDVGIAELLFRKVRGGKPATAKVAFEGELTLFSDVEIIRTDLDDLAAEIQRDRQGRPVKV